MLCYNKFITEIANMAGNREISCSVIDIVEKLSLPSFIEMNQKFDDKFVSDQFGDLRPWERIAAKFAYNLIGLLLINLQLFLPISSPPHTIQCDTFNFLNFMQIINSIIPKYVIYDNRLDFNIFCIFQIIYLNYHKYYNRLSHLFDIMKSLPIDRCNNYLL
jgi:hypothetical protein